MRESAACRSAQVSQAEDLMRTDPSLSNDKSVRLLKWKSREQKDADKSQDEPAWVRWVRGLFGFMGSAGRAVVGAGKAEWPADDADWC